MTSTLAASKAGDSRDRDRSYCQHIDEVIAALGTDRRRGFSEDEARSRLAVYGRNELKPDPPIAGWRRFLEQFEDALVILLLVVYVPGSPARLRHGRLEGP